MEAINLDLESRLEAQAREYIELESDAVDSHGPECFPCTSSSSEIYARLARWKAQYKALSEESGNWRYALSHVF